MHERMPSPFECNNIGAFVVTIKVCQVVIGE